MMWYSIWNIEISIMLRTGCNQFYFWSVCGEHFGLSINEKNIDFYMDKPPSWKNFIDIYGPFNFPTYDEYQTRSTLWVWLCHLRGFQTVSDNFNIPHPSLKQQWGNLTHCFIIGFSQGLASLRVAINLRLESFVRIQSMPV